MGFFSPKKRSTHPKEQSNHLWRSHRKGWAVLLVLLTASSALVGENATHLQLSVLGTPEHAAFDGSVYPLGEVPDWLNSTSEQRNMTYDEFTGDFITIPSYDPDRLRETDLTWGDAYDDYTRNMQVTYTVPWSGSYRMNGIEGDGSHPGVDIVALKGTPVFSVFNGVVDKVSYSSTGFGNYILIRHEDVPTYENEIVNTTLYSGYGHLDTVQVTEGDVLTKGQQIGTVGDTGTATTDHLHFQIDNSDAPWHLYWPFTTAESNEAGGFYEAVNAGVGSENVHSYTVNPVEYVEKYLDTDSIAEEDVVISIEISDIVETTTEFEEEIEEVVETVPDEEVYVPPFTSIEVDYEPYLGVNEIVTIKVSLVDEVGELVRNPSFNSPIKVEIENTDVIEIFPLELEKSSFLTGEMELNVFTHQTGSSNVTFTFLDQTSTTIEFIVASNLKPVAAFSIETDQEFFIGEAEEVAILALNEDGERVMTVELEDTVRLEVIQGDGFFSREVLAAEDFEENDPGVATVYFTPTANEDVILGVSSGDLSGTSSLLSPSLFVDVDESHPYFQAIRYLKTTGTVEGYEDKTFRPDNFISRAEVVKILYFDAPLITDTNAVSFKDINVEAWYYPYLATAFLDGSVSGYPDGTFKPADEVNRIEFIKMLALSLGIDVDPVVIGNPYEDVHYLDWFAHYAQFVKETNIAPWTEGTLDASESITRSEVAEMIYRLKATLANDAEEYSRTLVL